MKPDRTIMHILGTESPQINGRSPLPLPPCLPGWVLPPAPQDRLSAAQSSAPHPLHWASHPGQPQGPTGRKRPAFCFCPLRQVRPGGMGTGNVRHTPVATIYGAKLSLPWAGSTMSHPAGNSLGPSYSPHPLSRVSLHRGCPSAFGATVLCGGETDFPSWGSVFSLSMGSANYVLCQESRPE